MKKIFLLVTLLVISNFLSAITPEEQRVLNNLKARWTALSADFRQSWNPESREWEDWLARRNNLERQINRELLAVYMKPFDRLQYDTWTARAFSAPVGGGYSEAEEIKREQALAQAQELADKYAVVVQAGMKYIKSGTPAKI